MLKFRLKSGHEVVSAVFEEHDETEREKHKENEPEKAADERHGADW